MTPEREARIRDTAAAFIALMGRGSDADPATSIVDLLAEIDRLRALPVIATCGECGWARDGGHSYDGPLVVCGKITHDSLGRRQTMSVADEPPTWCPLRGGGR